ncbi:hypothetical protein [Oscillatoria sp. FACHB-1406]|uniref:hypothetical protein n=1 Tax=Oscillatoria sp. FACHB-1406 TaxID=2692846 RepID=UPI0016830C7A|nr:hypothetical protein [Oscillatoria sp. FACHB-1406]MBD2577179.1 hypothetical protein [Oscillatoria sp. FACHB-1406]
MSFIKLDKKKKFIFFLLLSLIIIHILIEKLICTGDEPTYIYQGLGIFTNLKFYPSEATWANFLEKHEFNFFTFGKLDKPRQTIASSLLYGSLLANFNLEIARWANFTLGIIGIICLYNLLNSYFNDFKNNNSYFSELTIASISFSLPLIAYLKLIYPEVMLMSCITLSLFFINKDKKEEFELFNQYLSLFFAILLPFIHIRCLLVSLGLVGFIFASNILNKHQKSKSTDKLQIVIQVILVFLGYSCFVKYQTYLFGSITGSASAPFSPAIDTFFERLGMQLFSSQHGLLAYSPILLFGFPGLIIGCLKKNRLAIQALSLLFLYVITFIWGLASESMTARFWVAAIPFLSIGLYCWMYYNSKKNFFYLPIIPLFIINIINFIFFITSPNSYLENRLNSLTYIKLFKIIPINFGLILPSDITTLGTFGYNQTITQLLIGTFLLTTIIVISSVIQYKITYKILIVLCLIISLSPFFTCYSKVVSSEQYTIFREASGNAPACLKIDFKNNNKIKALQLINSNSLWIPPNYPTYFKILINNDENIVQEIDKQPVRNLVTFKKSLKISSIRLIEEPQTFDSPWLESQITIIQ